MKLITDRMQVQRELEKIEKEANNLSGYTDQDYGYTDQDYGFSDDDDEGYADDDDEGFADDDEAGAAGFKRRRRPKRAMKPQQLLDFKFNLTNTGSAPVNRTLALVSPFNYAEADLTSAGHTVAGIVRDGQVVPGATPGTNDVVGTAMRTNRPISLLKQYALYNNLRVIGMTVTSSNPNAFETDLQIVKLNPFKQEAEQTIDLSNYLSEDNLTGRKIEADFINDGLDFSWDNQTLVKMLLIAGVNVTVTLRFGGVDNAAAKFDRRAANAGSRIFERMIARGSKRR